MRRTTIIPPKAQTPVSMPVEVRLALRIEDAAEVMSLSRTAVYALLREGLLRAVRHGKRVIIPRTEIQRYLDANVA